MDKVIRINEANYKKLESLTSGEFITPNKLISKLLDQCNEKSVDNVKRRTITLTSDQKVNKSDDLLTLWFDGSHFFDDHNHVWSVINQSYLDETFGQVELISRNNITKLV